MPPFIVCIYYNQRRTGHYGYHSGLQAVAAARENMGCPTLDGVEMDTLPRYEGDTQVPGHLASRLYTSDVLGAALSPDQVLSRISLSLLADTGCLTNGSSTPAMRDAYCAPSEETTFEGSPAPRDLKCTFNKAAVGVCRSCLQARAINSSSTTSSCVAGTGCGIVQEEPSLRCKNGSLAFLGNGDASELIYWGQRFGPGSSCFEDGSVDWVKGKQSLPSQGAGCYRRRCVRSNSVLDNQGRPTWQLQVRVGDSSPWQVCPTGALANVATGGEFSVATIGPCPDNERFCLFNACPDDCNGNGECFNETCYCLPGFAGPSCSQRLCTPASCRAGYACSPDTGACERVPDDGGGGGLTSLPTSSGTACLTIWSMVGMSAPTSRALFLESGQWTQFLELFRGALRGAALGVGSARVSDASVAVHHVRSSTRAAEVSTLTQMCIQGQTSAALERAATEFQTRIRDRPASLFEGTPLAWVRVDESSAGLVVVNTVNAYMAAPVLTAPPAASPPGPAEEDHCVIIGKLAPDTAIAVLLASGIVIGAVLVVLVWLTGRYYLRHSTRQMSSLHDSLVKADISGHASTTSKRRLLGRHLAIDGERATGSPQTYPLAMMSPKEAEGVDPAGCGPRGLGGSVSSHGGSDPALSRLGSAARSSGIHPRRWSSPGLDASLDWQGSLERRWDLGGEEGSSRGHHQRRRSLGSWTNGSQEGGEGAEEDFFSQSSDRVGVLLGASERQGHASQWGDRRSLSLRWLLDDDINREGKGGGNGTDMAQKREPLAAARERERLKISALVERLRKRRDSNNTNNSNDNSTSDISTNIINTNNKSPGNKSPQQPGTDAAGADVYDGIQSCDSTALAATLETMSSYASSAGESYGTVGPSIGRLGNVLAATLFQSSLPSSGGSGEGSSPMSVTDSIAAVPMPSSQLTPGARVHSYSGGVQLIGLPPRLVRKGKQGPPRGITALALRRLDMQFDRQRKASKLQRSASNASSNASSLSLATMPLAHALPREDMSSAPLERGAFMSLPSGTSGRLIRRLSHSLPFKRTAWRPSARKSGSPGFSAASLPSSMHRDGRLSRGVSEDVGRLQEKEGSSQGKDKDRETGRGRKEESSREGDNKDKSTLKPAPSGSSFTFVTVPRYRRSRSAKKVPLPFRTGACRTSSTMDPHLSSDESTHERGAGAGGVPASEVEMSASDAKTLGELRHAMSLGHGQGDLSDGTSSSRSSRRASAAAVIAPAKGNRVSSSLSYHQDGLSGNGATAPRRTSLPADALRGFESSPRDQQRAGGAPGTSSPVDWRQCLAKSGWSEPMARSLGTPEATTPMASEPQPQPSAPRVAGSPLGVAGRSPKLTLEAAQEYFSRASELFMAQAIEGTAVGDCFLRDSAHSDGTSGSLLGNPHNNGSLDGSRNAPPNLQRSSQAGMQRNSSVPVLQPTSSGAPAGSGASAADAVVTIAPHSVLPSVRSRSVGGSLDQLRASGLPPTSAGLMHGDGDDPQGFNAAAAELGFYSSNASVSSPVASPLSANTFAGGASTSVPFSVGWPGPPQDPDSVHSNKNPREAGPAAATQGADVDASQGPKHPGGTSIVPPGAYAIEPDGYAAYDSRGGTFKPRVSMPSPLASQGGNPPASADPVALAISLLAPGFADKPPAPFPVPGVPPATVPAQAQGPPEDEGRRRSRDHPSKLAPENLHARLNNSGADPPSRQVNSGGDHPVGTGRMTRGASTVGADHPARLGAGASMAADASADGAQGSNPQAARLVRTTALTAVGAGAAAPDGMLAQAARNKLAAGANDVGVPAGREDVQVGPRDLDDAGSSDDEALMMRAYSFGEPGSLPADAQEGGGPGAGGGGAVGGTYPGGPPQQGKATNAPSDEEAVGISFWDVR
eukprot:jgi/Mesvir1/3935/Mv05607-RA.1